MARGMFSDKAGALNFEKNQETIRLDGLDGRVTLQASY
jgi:hypothetical protein